MKKQMKRLGAIFAALAMCLVLVACSGGGEPEKKTDPNVISIDQSEVKYLSHEVTKDYDGSDAIVITYQFTNNGEEAESFNWAFMNQLFQEGVELDYATIFVDEESFDTLDQAISTEIQPGNSLEVKTTHKLKSLSAPVEVHFESIFTDEKDSFEIKL